MDGIFGVGLPEMVIVALALFIVGGPKNTAKWAREMGVWVRKAREAWAQMMAEMEQELGPEGKEVMDAAREISRGARDARNLNPTRRMMGETLRMVEEAIDIEDDDRPKPAKTTLPSAQTEISIEATPASSSNNGSTTPSDTKYTAWIPPDSSD